MPNAMTTTLTPLPTPSAWALTHLATCDSGVRVRRLIEIAVVEHLLRTLIDAGYGIDLDDGGDEPAVRNSRDVAELLDAAFAVDDCMLYVRAPGANLARGWTHLVFGNDGWDCISDHTTNLTAILQPTADYAEALSEWM